MFYEVKCMDVPLHKYYNSFSPYSEFKNREKKNKSIEENKAK